MPGAQQRLWLPLVDGSERLGVLSVVADQQALGHLELLARLQVFAALSAELTMTKTLYGDTIVRLRRTGTMALAAEMQWSLPPPLKFACEAVTVAAALEPAYQVAPRQRRLRDRPCCARVAVFDGMGHGLQSA